MASSPCSRQERVQLVTYRTVEPGAGVFHITLWREGDGYFYAKTPTDVEEPPLAELIPFAAVELDSLHPVAPTGSAVAGISDACHVKSVGWHDWRADETNIGALFAREVEVLQAIADHPHPHLVEYLGIVPFDGAPEADGCLRIAGLVSKRYTRTLSDALRDPEAAAALDRPAVVADISSALDHLHSLGYAHNDVSLGNIMLDDAGRAVLIDFDAALPIGVPLSLKYGTEGFILPAGAPAPAGLTPQLGYDGDSGRDSEAKSMPSVDVRRGAAAAAAAAAASATAVPSSTMARISCADNDAYALSQVAARLNGDVDPAAEAAREAARKAEEAELERIELIERWTELVRLGRWTLDRMECAKRSLGYD